MSIYQPVVEGYSQISKKLFEAITPYIKGRVLEINSGFLSLAQHFVKSGINLHLSDLDPNIRTILHKQFAGTPTVRDIHDINVTHENFNEVYSHYVEAFGSILLLGGSEKSFNYIAAIANMRHLLRENGHLVVALPAHTVPYYNVEEAVESSLEDLKLCNRKIIKELLSKGWERLVTSFFYFPTVNGAVENLSQKLFALVIAKKVNDHEKNTFKEQFYTFWQ